MAINLPSDGSLVKESRKWTDAMWAWMRDITKAVNAAATGVVTAVTATSPIISSGGTTPNISHAASGVTAATYGDSTHVAQVAINATGHVTSASNVAIAASGVTSVTGTAPIASSGGATPAISLNDTAVTPGSYTLTSLTVDQKGRITAASNGTAGTVTSVTGTSPIASTGGATPAISLNDTAVTPATYGDATHVGQFTVDQQGRLTFAQNVVITASGGGSWIPLVDGSEPPVFITDGAGHLILVAYP